jgi:glycosyltransferase involved in cell wall biosynthesis
MPTPPLISVIIPTYNRADLLPRAVRSACGQTYRNLEILIVDDASSDNTEEIALGLEKEDARVRYIKREKNGGESAARNTGIRKSTGEYVAFLDSDDEWLPEKIEKQMKVFEKNAGSLLGGVFCGYENVCKQNKKTSKERPFSFRGDISKQILLQNVVLGGGSGLMIKKKYLDIAGIFDEHKLLKIGPDYELWIRLAQHCHFDYVPDVCFRYYIHATNITQTAHSQTFIQSQDYIFHKHAALYAQYPTQHAQALARYALRLVLYRNPQRALQTFLQALRMKPLVVLYSTPVYAAAFALKMLRKKMRGC